MKKYPALHFFIERFCLGINLEFFEVEHMEKMGVDGCVYCVDTKYTNTPTPSGQISKNLMSVGGYEYCGKIPSCE